MQGSVLIFGGYTGGSDYDRKKDNKSVNRVNKAAAEIKSINISLHISKKTEQKRTVRIFYND